MIRPIIAGALWIVFVVPAYSSDMVEVPAGPFVMGDDADPDAAPRRRVVLDTFFIDRLEVTNAEYAEQFPDHGFPPGAEGHPVASISWRQAVAFCGRLDKRLPTGAEWEKAARGSDGLLYPWGGKKPRRKPHPFHSGLIKRKVGFDKKDVSVYGVRGMASSVWEWTASGGADKKVVRGGLWNFHLDYEYSKTFEKNFIPADKKFIFLGFRCARSKK